MPLNSDEIMNQLWMIFQDCFEYHKNDNSITMSYMESMSILSKKSGIPLSIKSNCDQHTVFYPTFLDTYRVEYVNPTIKHDIFKYKKYIVCWSIKAENKTMPFICKMNILNERYIKSPLSLSSFHVKEEEEEGQRRKTQRR